METAETGTPENTEGQSSSGPDDGQTTAANPEGAGGQVADGTTNGGPQDEAFFDPKQVPDELKVAYKQMQAAFTKRMQGLKEVEEKIQAYDAFSQDPINQMKTMAERYGYDLVHQGQQPAPQNGEDFQPTTWDQVFEQASEMAERRIMDKLSPMLNEVQSMKATAIEKALDDVDPMWRNYEKEMMENLRLYPEMAKKPADLYRLSVPQSVMESRATQAALQKLENKTKSGAVSGGSQTTRRPAENLEGEGPRTFAESVEAAKKKLASEGIAPG